MRVILIDANIVHECNKVRENDGQNNGVFAAEGVPNMLEQGWRSVCDIYS